MSLEEENEVDSVGSMPPLTVQSKVEASDQSSGELRASQNIEKKLEGDHDEGRGAKWRGLDPILDMWIVEWSDDLTPYTKNDSHRRETHRVE